MAKTPGMAGIYKSELLAIILAATHGPPDLHTIFTDSQGAWKAITSNRSVIRQFRFVMLARRLLSERGIQLKWVKAHAGIEGNEMADVSAKIASKLPPQPPMKPREFWDLAAEGELMAPPHKTWTQYFAPHHSHRDINHLSWRPIRQMNLRWVRWLFACVMCSGYSFPTTFWAFPPAPTKVRCTTCRTYHNLSVHGYLAFCPTHPLSVA